MNIGLNRIKNFLCPAVYHQLVHGLSKPYHLSNLYFRRHSQSIRVGHYVNQSRSVKTEMPARMSL